VIAPDSEESPQQNLEVGVEKNRDIRTTSKDASSKGARCRKPPQEPELAAEQQIPTDSSQVEQQSEPELNRIT